MTNPIEAKLAELSPTYRPHNAQQDAIRTVEDPQKIAESIDQKLAAITEIANRHWGEGVAEIDDLLSALVLYTPSAWNPDTASVSVLYAGLSNERIFELGKRAGADTRSEDEIILSAIFADILGREPDADELAIWLGMRADGMGWAELVPSILKDSLGNDYFGGGEGFDTLFVAGNSSSYTLEIFAGSDTLNLADRRTDGTGDDAFDAIELLQFGDGFSFLADGAVDIRMLAGVATLTEEELREITEVYIAYFNRSPDAIGLNFWGTAFANGTTLEQMAALFIDQDETRATYPEGTSNTDFVTAVYDNVLGRIPDQAGFNFWIDMLNRSEETGVTRDQFILEVLRGVQDGSPDRAYLDSKVDIGAYYAVHRGMSDPDNAVAAMALFDGTQASIDDAVAAIDGFYQDALDPINGEFLMQVVGVLDNPFAA